MTLHCNVVSHWLILYPEWSQGIRLLTSFDVIPTDHRFEISTGKFYTQMQLTLIWVFCKSETMILILSIICYAEYSHICGVCVCRVPCMCTCVVVVVVVVVSHYAVALPHPQQRREAVRPSQGTPKPTQFSWVFMLLCLDISKLYFLNSKYACPPGYIYTH